MKKTKKKVFSFICPLCKNLQKEVLNLQTGSMDYCFDFESEQYEAGDFEADDGGVYTCSDCGRELPAKLQDKIYKVINK